VKEREKEKLFPIIILARKSFSKMENDTTAAAATKTTLAGCSLGLLWAERSSAEEDGGNVTEYEFGFLLNLISNFAPYHPIFSF
jgi:hypothetical protein